MDLDLHPCHHCGLVGQDPQHPDCRCSASLKFDCPCNPGALAFPLILPAGGSGPRDWVNPEKRKRVVQEQIDSDFVKSKVQEAKMDQEIAAAKFAIRAAYVGATHGCGSSKSEWLVQKMAAKSEFEERRKRWNTLAFKRFQQELEGEYGDFLQKRADEDHSGISGEPTMDENRRYAYPALKKLQAMEYVLAHLYLLFFFS